MTLNRNRRLQKMNEWKNSFCGYQLGEIMLMLIARYTLTHCTQTMGHLETCIWLSDDCVEIHSALTCLACLLVADFVWQLYGVWHVMYSGTISLFAKISSCWRLSSWKWPQTAMFLAINPKQWATSCWKKKKKEKNKSGHWIKGRRSDISFDCLIVHSFKITSKANAKRALPFLELTPCIWCKSL